MSRTRIAVIFAVILAVLGIYVVAGGAFEGDSSTDEDQTVSTTDDGAQPGADEEQPLGPEEERGQMLFVDNCGACHTLDAAGTNGAVGPNLDEAQHDMAEVLAGDRAAAGAEPGQAAMHREHRRTWCRAGRPGRRERSSRTPPAPAL